MATDLSNWSATTDNDVYQKKEVYPYGNAADKKKQKVNIDGNKKTGDFTVSATGAKLGGLEGFAIGTDIPIYSFDADQNNITILNEKYFDAMFRGDKGRNDNFRKVNKQSKIDILSIATQENNTPAELNDLTSLISLKSYRSAKNIVNVAPQTIVSGANNSTTSSVNSAIRPIDMGILSSSDFSLNVVDSKTGGNSQLTSTGAQYFRYPEGRIPNLGYDYIQITSYKYVAGLSLPEPGDGSTSAKSYIRTNNKQTTSGKILAQTPENIIQLPMTGGLSETSSVQWSSDTLSEINLIAGNIAYNNIAGGKDPGSAVINSFVDLMKTGKEALSDPNVQKQLMAYFAGQAVSAPNFVQRATGKKINNNMELLFNGPTLRSFNFSFKLRPRTESESVLCRNIIKSLKRDSAPKTSKTNLFLETPNVFQIKYIYQAQDGILPSYTEHPFLNVMKPCALTSINVNYTPDGSYMTYETNGSMVGYDLNLTFQEIEPVYRSDQEDEYTKDNMGF